MLPENLLDVEHRGDLIIPRYLTSRDHHWVQAVQDELQSCTGLARRTVDERLDGMMRRGAPRPMRAVACLLLKEHGFAVCSAIDPAAARAALFLAAAEAGVPRDRSAIVAQTAAVCGVSSEQLERALYADAPAERRLEPLASPPATQELIERYNLALLQGLLMRADWLRVQAGADLKAVVRFARLQGLICTAKTGSAPMHAPQLELSGPLSLFRHTLKYGRAMARWLPALTRAPDWRLEARCVLRGHRGLLRASHRDPIGSTHRPCRRFDSKLEERLFRDIKRLGTKWEILREADLAQSGARFIFPDFTLLDRIRGFKVAVEIVGYWTPEYLDRKLDAIRCMERMIPWILCVDQDLMVASRDELDALTLPVLRFRRRVDAAALLALAESSVRAR